MAVVSAPLLSFGASGQIAKTQVYSTWKGRPYVRRLVIPSNPRSVGQTETRSTFTFLNSVWKVSPGDFQAPWTAYARGLVMTDRNAFLKKNIAPLRGNADLAGIILSPGAAGGLASTINIAGGAGDITIDGSPPAPLPAGWTVIKLVGAAILDQDPATGTAFEVFVGSDETSTYQVVLTDLDPGTYRAAGWFVYQRSASLTDLAYGPGAGEPIIVT